MPKAKNAQQGKRMVCIGKIQAGVISYCWVDVNAFPAINPLEKLEKALSPAFVGGER